MESLISFSDGLFNGDFLESKIFYTILALVVFWLIRRISLIVLLRGRDVQVQYRIRKSVAYITYPLAFLVIGRIWFAGFQAVSTYLGLLSAGLAIALQTPLVNLAGWAFILWRQPFKVGDRVQLGDHRGDVIDQRIFMFSLMEIGNWVDSDQSTGRVIHIPNGKIFNEVLANYSQGFQYIWNEIPVLVTFESDWRKAKQILDDDEAAYFMALKYTDAFSNDAHTNTCKINEIPDGWMGLDIGPNTEAIFSDVISASKTILWNGPMGVFEFSNFAGGTIGICEALANLTDATTIIGGGDSAAAVIQNGYADKMTHISTGGGASLEYLEGKVLPGVACVDEL